jgi:hypothetical protein
LMFIQASFAVYIRLFCCVYRPLLLCIQASFAVYTGLFCCVYRPLLLLPVLTVMGVWNRRQALPQ